MLAVMNKKIEVNKIFNESCLETLKRIPDNFVQAVITSPPYNMNLRIRKGEYCSRQLVKEISTKYDGFDDNLPIDEYNKFHSDVLKELLRVSNLVFYVIQIVTGSKRSIFKMIGDFSENLKDIIIWDKGYAEPAIQEQVLNRRSELILVFEKDYPISRQFRSSVFKRGSLDDVLARYIKVENKYNPDSIIRLTGDCPLVMPELIDKMVEDFESGDWDYMSNALEPTFPDGLDIEVVDSNSFLRFSTQELTNDEIAR